MKREYTSQLELRDMNRSHIIFNSIASTLVAQFILDLRSVYHDSCPNQTLSTIKFTVHAGGDLAVPLGPEFTRVTGKNYLESSVGDFGADFGSDTMLGRPVCNPD